MDDRTLSLLEGITQLGESATARMIAAACPMPQATAYRRLSELETLGVVERSGRGFRIGGRLYRLLASGLNTETLISTVSPAAAALAEATGEVCFAARLVDIRVEIFLTESPRAATGVSVVPPLGNRPASICSASKAILAHLPPGLRSEILAASAKYFHQLPARRPEDLDADLIGVQETGIAYCIGDEDPDCASIAAPVKLSGGYGQLCLGLSGPRSRMTEKLRGELASELRHHVERLEASGKLNF